MSEWKAVILKIYKDERMRRKEERDERSEDVRLGKQGTVKVSYQF